MFLSTESNYFTNYADDTTPCIIGNDSGEAVSKLKTIAEKLFTWFARSEMNANLDKYHLLLSTTEAFNFEILERLTLEKAAGSNLRQQIKIRKKTYNHHLSESQQKIECSGKNDLLYGLRKKTNINECIFQFSV